jgi:hypothetical protein
MIERTSEAIRPPCGYSKLARKEARLILKRLAACSAFALVGIVAVPLAAGGSVAASNARAHEYRLPSDGWKPGSISMSAAFHGRFYATHTTSGACAWIGEPGERVNYLWPAGYSIRLHPTELVDPTGKVIAHQGQEISSGGGIGSEAAQIASLRHCKKAATGVAEIQGPVLAG